MATETIRIKVEAEAARAYENAPIEKQRKLDVLLSLRLREATGAGNSLESLMREISARARARGLTEEALSELLRDE